jgi:hypothetical protein
MLYSKLDEIRFWSYVNVTKQNNGCWYWRGSKHKFGYGWFRLKNKTYLAHRLALIFFSGEEKKKLQVLHACDNPYCCNPQHLRWGTPKDNVYDAIERHRKTDPPIMYGEKHPFAKLTWDDVDKIRRMRAKKVSVSEIARLFNISNNGVYRVIGFQNWKPEYRKEGTK